MTVGQPRVAAHGVLLIRSQKKLGENQPYARIRRVTFDCQADREYSLKCSGYYNLISARALHIVQVPRRSHLAQVWKHPWYLQYSTAIKVIETTGKGGKASQKLNRRWYWIRGSLSSKGYVDVMSRSDGWNRFLGIVVPWPSLSPRYRNWATPDLLEVLRGNSLLARRARGEGHKLGCY